MKRVALLLCTALCLALAGCGTLGLVPTAAPSEDPAAAVLEISTDEPTDAAGTPSPTSAVTATPTAEATTPAVTATPSPKDTADATSAATGHSVPDKPEDVVKLYFERWADKDLDSMNQLVVKKQRLTEDGLDLKHLIGVEMQASRLVTDREDARYSLFGQNGIDGAETAVVEVDFTVEYSTDGDGGGFGPGVSTLRGWGLWLVKETEDSPWQIMDWGY